MKKSSKIFITLALIVILAAAGVATYVVKNHKKDTPKQVVNGINYAPPTDEEKQQAEDNKKKVEQRIETEKAATDNPTTTARTVQPVVAYADQYDTIIEVSSFIPNVIEDNGTCTLALTQGTTTIQKTSVGQKDATTTRCPLFSVPRSEFKQSGKWAAVVSYQSATAQGSSQSKDIDVK